MTGLSRSLKLQCRRHFTAKASVRVVLWPLGSQKNGRAFLL